MNLWFNMLIITEKDRRARSNNKERKERMGRKS